jgi:hypothetical protein
VLSTLCESLIKMSAWDIEEQVRQVPTCALTSSPTPTTIPTVAITIAIVSPSLVVTFF